MQFRFMQIKRITDALFILRRLQKEYLPKNSKLNLCSIDLEKAFDRVPRKVVMDWSLQIKGIPEVTAKVMMSSYKRATTKMKIISVKPYKISLKVGAHQSSVLSPLLFAIVIDVMTENARNGVLHKILQADDLVLMTEFMEELQQKCYLRKPTLESKEMKVNINKTKLMMSGIEQEAKCIQVVCVARKQWLILLCLLNVDSGFTEDARKGRN